jgi:hypothetical protein
MPTIMSLQGPALNCLNCGWKAPLPAPLAGVVDTVKANPLALLAIGVVAGAFSFRALARAGHAETWGVQRYDQARARSLHGARRRRRRR